MCENSNKPVELFGYSERGMINAICDDILHCAEPLKAAEQFLSLCRFPFEGEPPHNFTGLERVQILVEQSFSDFGLLDLMLLLDHTDGRKQAGLIEAKVATAQGGGRVLRDHWFCFTNYSKNDRRATSSLFVQLHRKVRLVRKITQDQQAITQDQQAITETRSLGGNPIVAKAANLLAGYAKKNAWYVALVPDKENHVQEFIAELAAYEERAEETALPRRPLPGIGFMTWPALDGMCRGDQSLWPQTSRNFQFNGRHIFRPAGAAGAGPIAIETRRAYWLGGGCVVVIRLLQNGCWAVPLEQPGTFFPKSFHTDGELFKAIVEQPAIDYAALLPRAGARYEWSPPADEDYIPKGETAVPKPPLCVLVRNVGPHASRVNATSNAGEPIEPSFRIFNYHLCRQELRPV